MAAQSLPDRLDRLETLVGELITAMQFVLETIRVQRPGALIGPDGRPLAEAARLIDLYRQARAATGGRDRVGREDAPPSPPPAPVARR